MAVPNLRRPIEVSDLLYTVLNGISGATLTEPLMTMMKADAAAIRLSLDRTYIVEVWHRDRVISWYANGVRG